MNLTRLLPSCRGNETIMVEPVFVGPSRSLHVVSLVLGVIALALSLACLVFNLALRNNRVIKMSSPRLNIVIASGAILGSLCCILAGIDYHLNIDSLSAKIICQVRQSLVVIAFSLAYVPMVTKTWRVNQIFKLAGTKRVVIRDVKLLFFTLCLVLLDVGILLLRFFLDPVDFTHLVYLQKMTSSRDSIPLHSLHNEVIMASSCASQNSWLWVFVFVAIKLPVLLLGMRESWWTRGMILPQLNDSTALTISVMTTVSMTTLYMAVSLGMPDHPMAGSIASVVCLWIATMAVIIVVFVPKLLLWKQTPKGHLAHRVSISSTCSSAAVLQSFEQMESGLVSANAEITNLKAFIKEKEMNIEKLQALLSDAEDNLAQIGLDPPSPVVADTRHMPLNQSCGRTTHVTNGNGKTTTANNNNKNNNNNDNDKNSGGIKTLSRCLPNMLTPGHASRIPSDNVFCRCCEGHDLCYDLDRFEDCQCRCHLQMPRAPPQHRHHVPSKKARKRTLASRGFHSSHEKKSNCSCHSDAFEDNDLGINSDSSIDYQTSRPSESYFHRARNHTPNMNKTNNNYYFQTPIKTTTTTTNNNNKNSNKFMIRNDVSSSKRVVVDQSNESDTEILQNAAVDIDAASALFDTERYCRYRNITATRRRRRSSTPSVHSLEKLNRLRSDLNDALTISTSLRSDWTTELARATKRARRTHKRYARQRRQSFPAIKQLTDSFMASYDFRQSFDNQSYVSDCLTSASSEYSNDQRISRSRNASGNSKEGFQGGSPIIDQGLNVPELNKFDAIANGEAIYSSTFHDRSSESSYYNGKRIPVIKFHKAPGVCSHGCNDHVDPQKDSAIYSVGDMDVSRNQPIRAGLEHHRRATIRNDSLYPFLEVKISPDEMYDTVSNRTLSGQTTEVNLKEGRKRRTGILLKNTDSCRNTPQRFYHGNSRTSTAKGQVTFADTDFDRHVGESNSNAHTPSRIALHRSQSDNELLNRSSSRHPKEEETLYNKSNAIDLTKGQEVFSHSMSERDLGFFKSGGNYNRRADAPSGSGGDEAASRPIRFQGHTNQGQCFGHQQNSSGRPQSREKTTAGVQFYLDDQESSCDSFA